MSSRSRKRSSLRSSLNSKSKLKKSKTYVQSSSSEEEKDSKDEKKTVIQKMSSDSEDDVKSNQHETFKKKIKTQIDLKKQMNPSNEELEYRNEELKKVKDRKDFSKIFKCTKCNWNFESLIKKQQKVNVHPVLDVLMCQKCCDYYEDGDFSLDSDNEDKYCRWCGEGGTIYTCSKCICGFCSTCIKKHFGVKALSNVKKEDEWLCYFCNPKPLWNVRFICYLAKKECESKKKELHPKNDQSKIELNKNSVRKKSQKLVKKVSSPKKNSDEVEGEVKVLESEQNSEQKRKQHYSSSSSDESDEISSNRKKKILMTSTPVKEKSGSESSKPNFESKKIQTIERLENVLKLFGYKMEFGKDWSTKKFNQLQKFKNLTTESSLKKECQKIKWFMSTLGSYIVGFSNSVDNIEKMLSEDEVAVANKPPPENSVYTSILQFLNFITNQVKIFNEKGIQFKDVIEAEMFKDSTVLGLKKKGECTPNTTDATTVYADATTAVTDDADAGSPNFNKNRSRKGEKERDESTCAIERKDVGSNLLDELEKEENSQSVLSTSQKIANGESESPIAMKITNSESKSLISEKKMGDVDGPCKKSDNVNEFEFSDEKLESIISILDSS